MTHNRPRPDLVPTSSQAAGRPPEVTSSLVPHPYRGRGHSGRPGTTTDNTPSPRPRDEVANTNQPGNRYILTDRTRPFWNHVRDLLVDGDWHPRDELYTLGKRYDLAERTVANLLPRASKRRWIQRSRGHVRIRDRAAFDQALAAVQEGAR